MQRYGFDFLERFSPTVVVSSVRLLAALACEQDLSILHVDIQQAFIRSELKGVEVYMKMPQGCGPLSGLIVKLNRSLYGLRQAAREWHATLKKCLVQLGFEQCLADACVFRLCEEGVVVCTLVCHVDDLFVCGKKERCERFAEDLGKMVPVTNLGELKWYSGCRYDRDREQGRLTISQQRTTEELVEEYGITKGRSIPLGGGVKLGDFDPEEEPTIMPFRELVGSLMWLSTQTRPDISNAVRAVARYCASPKKIHWLAALDILRYLKRTSSYGISFQRGSVAGVSIQAFTDADYASKAADRRSVSGGAIMCGGGCVSWFSRTQKCVTLSTTEAEYVAMGDVVKEVLFVRHVWRFMLPEVGMPVIPVYEDNEGAISIADNPINNSNSKHIDVRHHFLRELIARKEITVVHVGTKYQHADFLTKALTKDAFERHRNFVMNLQL